MRYKYTFGIIGIILLMLPIFIGTTISGSKLWIRIAGFTIQPGEFAKVFIVLFLAGYLAENRELLSISNRKILGFKIPRLRLLLPLFAVWGVCLLVVVFERDLGSAVLFYTIFLLMLYVATGRFSYVVIGLALLAVARGRLQVPVARSGALPSFGSIRLRTPRARATRSSSRSSRLRWRSGRCWHRQRHGQQHPCRRVRLYLLCHRRGRVGLLGGGAVLILFMLFAVRGLTTVPALNPTSPPLAPRAFGRHQLPGLF